MAVAVGELARELNAIASDPQMDAADRLAALRSARADLAFLLGLCDRYAADQELQREGAAMGRVRDFLAARENADVRGELLDRGLAPEQLDAAGLLSHDELDRRSEDGTIEEAVVGVAHLFDAGKHPRGRGGKFATSGRVVPRGRRGQTLTGPQQHRELPQPPHSPGTVEERPLHLGGVRSAAVREALGSFVDTQQKYSMPAPASPGTTREKARHVYTPERTAQHREWIEEALKGGKTQPKGKRHAVWVAGGPGSGKSSAEDFMPKHPGAVEIDPDWFKAKIKEFQDLAAIHDPYASDAVHEESSDLAHQARNEAMRRGYNVIVQGTGDSGPQQFANKIREAHKKGYRNHVFAVSAPTAVANERAKARALKNGRAVAEAPLREMHANVSRRWPEVEALAPHLESLQLWDSREDTRKGGKPHLMEHLDKPSGKLVEDDSKLLGEYRAKVDEAPQRQLVSPSYD